MVWFNIKKKCHIPYTRNIPRYELFEVLGIVFDQYLKFNEHISRVTLRASSSLFLLLRLKRLGFYATELGILYQSLVLSWNCCIGGCSAATWQNLDQVRRRAVRMGVISDCKPIGEYIRLHDRKNWWSTWDTSTQNLHRREIRLCPMILTRSSSYISWSREQLALQKFSTRF